MVSYEQQLPNWFSSLEELKAAEIEVDPKEYYESSRYKLLSKIALFVENPNAHTNDLAEMIADVNFLNALPYAVRFLNQINKLEVFSMQVTKSQISGAIGNSISRKFFQEGSAINPEVFSNKSVYISYLISVENEVRNEIGNELISDSLQLQLFNPFWIETRDRIFAKGENSISIMLFLKELVNATYIEPLARKWNIAGKRLNMFCGFNGFQDILKTMFSASITQFVQPVIEYIYQNKKILNSIEYPLKTKNRQEFLRAIMDFYSGPKNDDLNRAIEIGKLAIGIETIEMLSMLASFFDEGENIFSGILEKCGFDINGLPNMHFKGRDVFIKIRDGLMNFQLMYEIFEVTQSELELGFKGRFNGKINSNLGIPQITDMFRYAQRKHLLASGQDLKTTRKATRDGYNAIKSKTTNLSEIQKDIERLKMVKNFISLGMSSTPLSAETNAEALINQQLMIEDLTKRIIYSPRFLLSAAGEIFIKGDVGVGIHNDRVDQVYIGNPNSFLSSISAKSLFIQQKTTGDQHGFSFVITPEDKDLPKIEFFIDKSTWGIYLVKDSAGSLLPLYINEVAYTHLYSTLIQSLEFVVCARAFPLDDEEEVKGNTGATRSFTDVKRKRIHWRRYGNDTGRRKYTLTSEVAKQHQEKIKNSLGIDIMQENLMAWQSGKQPANEIRTLVVPSVIEQDVEPVKWCFFPINGLISDQTES